jgi:hypothetical protein
MRAASLLLAVVVVASSACGGGGSTTDPLLADARAACPAPPDARTACGAPDAGCDPFLHCGCGTAQKCTAGTVGLECVAAGARTAGQVCGADSECERGTLCVPFLGVTQCLRFCDAAHACPGGEACYVVVADRGQRAVAEACGPTCDLLAQDCPASGLGCFTSQKECAPERGVCLAPGGGAQGATCASMADCAAGNLCIDPGGPAPPICAKICGRKGTGPTCTVGTTCRDLPGHTQTGICLP